MGDVFRIRSLRGGAHSTINDFSATPGTIKFINQEEGSTAAGEYAFLPRDTHRGDGRDESSLQGPKSGAITITEGITGLANGGAGDGELTVAATELGIQHELIQSVWNTTAVNRTGDTSDASPGTGAQVVLDGVPADLAAESAVLIAGDEGGKYAARFVTAVTSQTLTTNAALYKADGTADTPAAASVVFAGAYYPMNQATGDAIHMYFDAEGESKRRIFDGCLGNLTLDLSTSNYAKYGYTAEATDVDFGQALANPTYVAPSQGNNIIHVDSEVSVGGSRLFARELAFDFGLETAAREATGGVNGFVGFKSMRIQPKFTFNALFGVIGGAVSDATLATWRADAVFDLCITVGRSGGGAMAIWFPAARLEAADPVSVGGQLHVAVTAMPTRNTTSGINSDAFVAFF